MCLIVDANVAAAVFTEPANATFLPVTAALLRNVARVVLGGTKLRREYRRVDKIRRFLTKLDSIGAVRQVPDKAVDKVEKDITDESLCVSDDQHIIALARVSHVRLLCSDDKALHTDFTNSRLLQPQGSVYQSSQHQHLIRRHCARKKPKKS